LIAYKLVRVRKDGSIGSLFINCRRRLPVGRWIKAESYPTKGFALRPGWHATHAPRAPHLSMRGRAWYKAEIKNFTKFRRPAAQGGLWYLAQRMRLLAPTKEEAT